MIDWFFLAFVYLLMIIVHEYGHLIYFYNTLKRKNVQIHFGFYKKKFRLCTGFDEDYKGIKKDQLNELYTNGVVFGLAVPIIAMVLRPDHLIFLLAMVLFGGWSSDVAKIAELEKSA